MVNNLSDILNSRLRFSGMASGLDTDAIVQQLMRAESMKLDNIKQDKQLLEWKREDYRSITNAIRDFKDTYFNVTRPLTNMRSEASYIAYKVHSTYENIVTASGGSGVISMNHEITVTQIAKAASISNSAEVSDGTIIISDTLETVSNKLSDNTLSTYFADNNEFTLIINGKDIIVNKTDTLQTLVSKVNASNAGVTMTYSQFLDKFTVISKNTGTEGNSITIDDGGSGFLTSTMLGSKLSGGQDAIFTLDGKEASRETNIFAIDGVTYTLKGEGSSAITLEQNVDAIYNNIKNFVDAYNGLIDNINTKYNEKRERNYLPLTDEQKEAMKEDDIEKWEKKAKTGMLYRESLIENITSSMRRSLFDSIYEVSGSDTSKLSFNLTSIGITTGSYQERGKLLIDETKLKEAIKNSPQDVMKLFTKESDVKYSPDLTADQKKQRYEENGIIYRLFDTIEDNIRITRNADGKKGLLLERAGIEKDISDIKNTLSFEISKKDTLIEELLKKLAAKEENYYKRFTAMEKALSKMNTQSSWFAQQFGQQ